MSDAKEFGVELMTFSRETNEAARGLFVNIVARTKSSITDGDPVTGSEGQPVDQGILKASWTEDFETASVALISTNVEWAESNEDGIARPGGGPYTQHSPVGGRHSVAKTAANFDRIVDSEVAKVAGAR